MSDQNKLTKDVTVRLVELLDAIDDAVERGAPQLGGFDFSALSVAHEEIIRLRTAAEPEQKILSWLKANARKGRSTVSINLASNGDITLDNLGLSDAEEARRQRIDEYHAEESKLPSLAKEIARSVEPPADRKSALDEIVRISEEAGLYEDPPAEHPALPAGDVLAHQLTFKYQGDILEAWWKARGGHDKCTVCNPPSPNRT